MPRNKPPPSGHQIGIDFAPPPPGYRLGLDFAPARADLPPGYALGLEFFRGPVPPRPPTSVLRPGGSLPAPHAPLAGTLRASAQDNTAALHPGGALPWAPPAFVGTLHGFYAEQHQATPTGTLPLAAPIFSGQLAAPYSSNVDRPLARMAHALRYQQASRASAALAGVFQDARAAAAQVRAVVQQAQHLAAHTTLPSQQATAQRASTQDRAQQAQPLRLHAPSAYQVARILRANARDATQEAQRLQAPRLLYAWQITAPHRGGLLSRYQDAGIQRHMGLRTPPALPVPIAWPGWRIALEFAPQFIAPRDWGELQTGPLISGGQLARPLRSPAFWVRAQDDMRPPPAAAKLPWPPEWTPDPDPDPTDPPDALITIPILRSYIVINDLSLQRADDGTPIAADAFSMRLDDGSWTWQWSASLPASEEEKIAPSMSGDPVEIIATVNSVPYRLLAESYRREREFAKGRISLQGRGRAALLDAPYAPIEDRTQPALITAQQLAEAQLMVNGVPTGWSVDWQLPDWQIPAGTWALQSAPIGALIDIATAAGGMVLPHRTDQTVRILPRYAAAPWHWASLIAPDFELPSAVVQIEGIAPETHPAYDRVHIAGTTADGVLVQATRAGQPGTTALPLVTHPLITSPIPAAARAVAELGLQGRVATVDLRLPVLPATGVIEPGQYVRYTDGPATTRLGAVRGVSVDWQRPRLRQTITLETHPDLELATP